MTQRSDFCIENTERGYTNWYDAINTCFNQGRRLCSTMEWMMACRNTSGTSISQMTGNWEWTSNVTRGPHEHAHRMHDCGNSDHSSWGSNNHYRCCKSL
tara:strand:- start:1669 stop:1965 length:297 start_codon:yes stop_codon:yes gene_type:complete